MCFAHVLLRGTYRRDWLVTVEAQRCSERLCRESFELFSPIHVLCYVSEDRTVICLKVEALC
jgi:hypothetical protein